MAKLSTGSHPLEQIITTLPSPPLSPQLQSAQLPSPSLLTSDTRRVSFAHGSANGISPSAPLQHTTSYDSSTKMERGTSAQSYGVYNTESELDPLLLRSRLHPEESINHLRRRKSDKKHIGQFYEEQNGRILGMLKSMDDHIEEGKEDEETHRTAVKIAVWASFIANVCLALLQLYAAISSLSLSFFATALDSIVDPIANGVLWYCHRKALRVDLRRYPSGGSRFETIGDIIYSGVMGGASVILISFSVQSLAIHTSDTPRETFHVAATVAVAVSFLVKLSLFLYCYPLRNKNSQVRVLWEDHRNDVAINALGIFTSAAGAKIVWWIDPLGAIVIACALIALWGQTLYSHFTHLAGVAAPLPFLQLLTYKAMVFADEIESIDNCIAYHSGPKYVVEIDIVMHSLTPLWKAHDISQALQDKLEELPMVERAFVHVDHEISQKPEHRKIK